MMDECIKRADALEKWCGDCGSAIEAVLSVPAAQRWTEGQTMAEPKKPFYRQKKWKLGNSMGWWNIPYCPHCKRKLGLMAEEQQVGKCPMCGKPLDWRKENG